MKSPGDQSQIVLASASPRRRQLLAAMGLRFETTNSRVNESVRPGESPQDLGIRLSLAKAEVAASRHPRSLIVAADTLIVLENQVLGKPVDEVMAARMLEQLRNREHSVYSGLTLIDTAHSRRFSQLAVTLVYMRDYTDLEIRRYIASGDPADKAGAYAIQHTGFAPVARIEGCYANVIGLPMCHLYRALHSWQIPVPVHPLECCPLARESGCACAADILQDCV
jgi:septum formation protein